MSQCLAICVFVSVVFATSLSSCGGVVSDDRADYKVFRYNEEGTVLSLDPAFARSKSTMWITNQVFDGLVKLDDSLRVVPAIAKRWEVSDDGRSYRFTLRDDVFFHQDECWPGLPRRVVASDFVYSFERIISPEVGSPGSWIFAGKVDEHLPFEAVDDTTFVLQLEEPFAPIMGVLTMQYCNVVPREAVEHYGSMWRSNPVGSGPFRFKKWVPNQALYLNAFDDYYEEELPYIDGVKVSFGGDKKIAFLDLLAGRLDYFSGLESSFINDLLTKQGGLQERHQGQLDYKKSPYLNLEYIGINMQSEHRLIQDGRIRQAMNYGVDRETMLSVLRNNVGKPARYGAVPAGMPGHALTEGYHYDMAKAKELVREAVDDGLDLGQAISLKTNSEYLDICTFVSNQWRQLGLKVEIEVVEAAYLREAMRQGDVELFRASWIADYPDAESYNCLFYSELPAPPNYTRFSDPQYDDWYIKAMRSVSAQERLPLIRKMDSTIINKAPLVLLFYDEKVQFTPVRVSGLQSNAIGLLDCSTIDLDSN